MLLERSLWSITCCDFCSFCDGFVGVMEGESMINVQLSVLSSLSQSIACCLILLIVCASIFCFRATSRPVHCVGAALRRVDVCMCVVTCSTNKTLCVSIYALALSLCMLLFFWCVNASCSDRSLSCSLSVSLFKFNLCLLFSFPVHLSI